MGREATLWSFRAVGALLVLLNAMHVTVGFARLRRALAAEPIQPRFDEALRTAWLYLGMLGLAVGALLLWIAPDAAAGDRVAWRVGVAIGAALVATGIGAFLATRRHPGLLVLSVFGLALLIPLLV